MSNFHISQDGVARECRAKTPESCTATSLELKEHYSSKEEAQKAYESFQNNKGQGLQGLSKNSQKSQDFTKESLMAENSGYIQRLKELDILRKKSKSKFETSEISAEKTKVASKLLDNAWDMKELTGSEKDLKRYKRVRNNTYKIVKKELAALEKELETWRNIHAIQDGYLDYSQIQHMKNIRKRRVSARAFMNDLKTEIIQEKNRWTTN